ncbi:MAG: hypothetical protein LBP92_09185 [Deltaproteobacteria bacterium]|jgi:hypothetical protein|nr:hypothetical protein [Deltaproteobacteria bacterium]
MRARIIAAFIRAGRGRVSKRLGTDVPNHAEPGGTGDGPGGEHGHEDLGAVVGQEMIDERGLSNESVYRWIF